MVAFNASNGGDDLDDFSDLNGTFAQLGHGLIRVLRHLHRRGGDFGGLIGVFGDLLNASAHLLGAGGHGGDVLTDLFGGTGDDIGLLGGLLGIGTHLLAGCGQFLGGGRDRLRTLIGRGERGFELLLGQLAGGNIRGKFHHFDRFAVQVEDRIVRSLDP